MYCHRSKTIHNPDGHPRRRSTGGMRRWALLLCALAAAFACVALLGAADPSAADCNPYATGIVYPPVSCQALVNTNTIAEGGKLGVGGAGFKPTTSVLVELHSSIISLGTLTSDSTGAVSGSVAIPDAVPVGTHDLDLDGVNADGTMRRLSATVDISAVAKSGSASSGPGAVFWTVVGLISAAVVGLLMLLVGRRGRGGEAG